MNERAAAAAAAALAASAAMIDIEFIDESGPQAGGGPGRNRSLGRVRCGAVPRAGEEIHFSGGAADVMRKYAVVRVEWSIRLDPDPQTQQQKAPGASGGMNAAAWVYVRRVDVP